RASQSSRFGKQQYWAQFAVAAAAHSGGVAQIIYIGKESNSLEDVESGTIHSAQSVHTEYRDPRREEWQTKILPAEKTAGSCLLMKLRRKSRAMLIRTLAGRRSEPTTPKKSEAAKVNPPQTRMIYC